MLYDDNNIIHTTLKELEIERTFVYRNDILTLFGGCINILNFEFSPVYCLSVKSAICTVELLPPTHFLFATRAFLFPSNTQGFSSIILGIGNWGTYSKWPFGLREIACANDYNSHISTRDPFEISETLYKSH